MKAGAAISLASMWFLIGAGLPSLTACDSPPGKHVSISSGIRLGRAVCGDQIWDYPLESCEDGNTEPGDGCDGDCHVEYGWNCTGGTDVLGWGDNYFGQSAPQAGPFVAISAGAHHTVGLRPDGSVVGWGRNQDGQSESQAGPFVAVDTGQFHTIGLRPNGSVVGWGSNISGQVEPNPGPFVAIACGREFNLGLYADGSVIGWGDNDQGQASYHAGPFVAIAAGGYHSLGLRADGSVEGWGENQWGEADSKPGPYIAIAAGDHHSLGLKADGSVDAWGDNRYGQGVSKPGPYIAIDAGGFHNLGLKADGSVSGWGFGYYGQTTKKNGPFAAFAAGGFHSVAIYAPKCTVLCGDGIVLGQESCDDMNTISGDGCSSTCQVEDHWVCEVPARPCRCAGIYVGDSCDRCPDGYWGFPDCRPCACDDGDACDGVEFCDPVDGCRPGVALICDDGRECSFDGCDPATGCRYDLSLCRCSTDQDCDDGDACSGVETCDIGRGLCMNGDPPVCDDGDACNGVETCDAIAGCVSGVPPACDDGRDCTIDSCDPVAGCTNDNSPCACNMDLDCDDLSVCTGADWCDISSGTCLSTAPLDCGDGRSCTIDSCDPVAGCIHDASACACSVNLDCDDLSRCTGVETCLVSDGVCIAGEPLVCDDNRDCSIDSCNIQTGCSFDVSGCSCLQDLDCDDHSVCTGTETCNLKTGQCAGGAPLNCRDGRACTVDTCDPVLGCMHDASNCVCESDEDCKAPYEHCLADENRCRNIVCAACFVDGDCGSGGNTCHRFDSGDYCMIDCTEGDFICPSGFVCNDVDGARLCMPVAGDCVCTPDVSMECRGSILWWVDSCGQPGRIERDCGSRGCLNAACCPEGYVSDGNACVEQVEVPPEAIADDSGPDDAAVEDSEAGDDVGPVDIENRPDGDAARDDAMANEDTASTVDARDRDVEVADTSIEGGGGCSALSGRPAGPGVLFTVAGLAALILVLMRRRVGRH